jgi:PAS domain S-box-containing protein
VNNRSRTPNPPAAAVPSPQAIADALPVLIAYVDRDLVYRFLNRTYEEWFGTAASSFLGKTVEEVVGENAFRTLKPWIDAALAGERVEFESEIPYARGEHRIIRASYVPDVRPDGRVAGYVSLVADISAAKRQEEALRASEARYRATEERFRVMANAAPVMVWIADLQTSCWWFNRTWLEFTGRAMSDETGFGWASGIHPDDRARVLEAYADAFRHHHELRMEFRLQRRDGVYRWVLNYGVPLDDGSPEASQFIGSAMDIHERKEVEEGREQLLRREREARAAAEAASRAKDQFLATVSHELRTPLNAILGWARILRQGTVTAAKAADALAVIEKNALAQTQLIDDILDVSRIISGKLRLDLRPVDLPAILDDALDALAPAASAKGIRVRRLIDPNATPVPGDADRLRQVIWNLASNAIKFTPAGGRVQVRLARHASEVELVVTDTGIGIPADTLPFVFDQFRQGDSGYSRSHGGLGLGLSIVRQLVEAHGGYVEAESEGPGRGATFRVKLPLTIAHEEPALHGLSRLTPATAPVEKVAPSEVLAGRRVLVVDDEADARELLNAALSMSGASVRLAGSAEEAIAILDVDVPDVLVSDLGMPQQSGLDLIRVIRERPPHRGGSIPALAVTAYARAEDRRRALQAGFQMHLPKPIEPEELAVAIQMLTAARR